jgi:hypothetical protein
VEHRERTRVLARVRDRDAIAPRKRRARGLSSRPAGSDEKASLSSTKGISGRAVRAEVEQRLVVVSAPSRPRCRATTELALERDADEHAAELGALEPASISAAESDVGA